jgi:hypothetical protein
VGGAGELVGGVAQVVLDLPERLLLGQVDKMLGHAAEGRLGVGPELLEQRLDPHFAVIRDL